MYLNSHLPHAVGERLVGLKCKNPQVQEFIDLVPTYMAKIKSVHEAVVRGNINEVKQCLTRKRFALSRDKFGNDLKIFPYSNYRLSKAPVEDLTHCKRIFFFVTGSSPLHLAVLHVSSQSRDDSISHD